MAAAPGKPAGAVHTKKASLHSISRVSIPEPPEPENLPVVETPTSPSSAFALSRFEFEAGKGNEGTKILMVEWDTSVGGFSGEGAEWEVSWEGKTTVLPIRDPETETEGGLAIGSGGQSRRVYFLLPPGAPVPSLVSITQLGGPGQSASGPTLRAKPMPAIFPAELISNGSDHIPSARNGQPRRGVLHTIWAKKRLRELAAEIETEMRDNVESVGLEMAMQEQQWIVDHFGLVEGEVAGAPMPTRLHIPQGPPGPGPASPRSPVGGRLGEKLKGLRGLATSPVDLAAAAQAARFAPPKPIQPPNFNSLSPGVSDVAVSSFGSMFPQQSRNSPKDVVSNGGGIGSLDAIMGSGIRPPAAGGDDVEEDLFALPMSPRSPEMKRSPFSVL